MTSSSSALHAAITTFHHVNSSLAYNGPPPLGGGPLGVLGGASAWGKFDNVKPVFVEQFAAPVTHVHSAKETLCCTVGDRVVLYRVDKEKKEGVEKLRGLTRFEGEAYSARLRDDDAKLVAAGSQLGVVRIFDVQTRSAMRTLTGHTSAAKVVRWSRNGHRVVSGSDDCTARVWDLATGNQVNASPSSAMTHADRIRALEPLDEAGNLYATGGYDHVVKVWDLRQGGGTRVAMSSERGEFPIECLLGGGGASTTTTTHEDGDGYFLRYSTSNFSLFSCGGNVISRWDLRHGLQSTAAATLSNHQKTITTLLPGNLCGHEERDDDQEILSASLDGIVKVNSARDLSPTSTEIHAMKFKGGILGLTTARREGRVWRLICGTAEGELVVKTQKGASPADLERALPEHHPARAGTHKHFLRGVHAKESDLQGEEDFVVVVRDPETTSGTNKRVKLRTHETHLKNFEYKAALDAALASHEPNAVVAVLEELTQRGADALDIAVSGRGEAELEPLLSFLSRFVTHPTYAPLLIHVCEVIVEVYAEVLGESIVIDGLFGRLDQQIRAEVELHRKLMSTMGWITSRLEGEV